MRIFVLGNKHKAMKRFSEFLEEHGAYERYMVEIRTANAKDRLARLAKDGAKIEYITGPFNWKESCAGTMYWEEINRAWMNEIKKEYEEINEIIKKM